MGTPEERNAVRGLVAGGSPMQRPGRAFHGAEAPSPFLALADRYYNGKIRSHPDLAAMYDRVLGPVRHLPMTMLEIGLGCTETTVASGWFNVPCVNAWTWQDQCVGYSVPLYRGYLPRVDLHVLEYNRECAETFAAKEDRSTFRLGNDRLHVGDQADEALLRRVVAGMRNGLDVVVDDGGHLFHQQMGSFLTLFPLLRG